MSTRKLTKLDMIGSFYKETSKHPLVVKEKS